MKGSKSWGTLLSVSLIGLVAGCALTQTASAQSACVLPDRMSLHALTTDNTLFSWRDGVLSANRVFGVEGTLIGIDFRLSDGPTGKLYGLTDSGKLYSIGVDPFDPQFSLVSTLSPRFAGGFQSLADFNPVLTSTANALRVIGSNDQNFAVVDSGGRLNATAVQTPMAYVQGDTNFGADANISGGAYDNNAAGATFTTFYGIDYDLDTLVTIADRTATGSSNTGGGKLKTLGPIVDTAGRRINLTPTADLDIVSQPATNGGFTNRAILANGRTLYCIDLASVNTALPPGSSQPVVATAVTGIFTNPLNPAIVPGGFIDIAVSPFATPRATALKANAGADTFFSPYFVGVVNACRSTGNIVSYTFEQASYSSALYPAAISNVMRPLVSPTAVGADFVQSLRTPFTTTKCAILVEGYDTNDVITMRVTVRDAAGNASSDEVALRGDDFFVIEAEIRGAIDKF